MLIPSRAAPVSRTNQMSPEGRRRPVGRGLKIPVLEGMVNGKELSDDIQNYNNGLYKDMKRKAEKRVAWRMLNLQ